MHKLTVEEFIERARQVHGDKYDYSKVEYVNNRTSVCIICPIHGEFWQRPEKHLIGRGCQKCYDERRGSSKRFSKNEFIERAKKIHGDKYDYSKVEYANANKKVCIICPIHGEFWQIPSDHFNGCGCFECSGKKKLTTEKFIERARQVHGDKYDYSKVEYKTTEEKVCIICPTHGEFWQSPHSHLFGIGCPSCGGVKKLTTEEFIERAKKIHGNKYDYSKVEYINHKIKVCIVCPTHGEFWQIPNDHLNEKGCPKCSQSHLESDVMEFFKRHNIVFEAQKTFNWLDKKKLDFFIPSKNIAIECQGLQHFKPIEYFGGEETFKSQQERDSRKKILCEENNIKLLYFSNLHIDYPYKVYEDKEELLNEILKNN